MQLHLSSWPEIEAYLAKSKAIMIPIGSTEQHGPNGLLGTDALCPEIIARRAGDEAGILVGPTFNVGQAQHHMGVPRHHHAAPRHHDRGDERLGAFAGASWFRTDLLAERSWRQYRHDQCRVLRNVSRQDLRRPKAANIPPLHCMLRNWWELTGVMDLCKQLFPVGEGSHATPSEVSITYFAYPEAIKHVAMAPKIAPTGPIYDAAGLPPPLCRWAHRLRSFAGECRSGREARRRRGQGRDRRVQAVRGVLKYTLD